MDLHQFIPIEYCQVQMTHYFCNSLSTWRCFYFLFAATRNEILKSTDIKKLAINLKFHKCHAPASREGECRKHCFSSSSPRSFQTSFVLWWINSSLSHNLSSAWGIMMIVAMQGWDYIYKWVYVWICMFQRFEVWSCHLFTPQRGGVWDSRKGCIVIIVS